MTSAAQSDPAAEERRPSPIALLFAPDRAMDRQARVGRTWLLLLFACLCSLLFASVLAVRVDSRSSTLRKLEKSGELKDLSDRQVADETRKNERVFQVVTIAKGVLERPLQFGLECLAVVGLSWFLRGRLKSSTLAPVVAATLLPGSFADLFDAAAAFRHVSVPPEGVPLAPRNLSAILRLAGHPLAEPWVKLGNALDFYSLWTACLLAFGLAAAAQLPRRRALLGTLVAWVCYRLLTQVAIGG